MKKGQAERGFSAVEVLIAIAVLLLVGAAGFFLWHKNHSKTAKNTAAVHHVTKTSTPVTLKTYTNDEYGFSFQYTETWKLSTDLSDSGRGHNEGDVIVESPSGTKVHFGPNLGGKGGDCWDDEANGYTTRTCSTLSILSVEKLSNGSADPIYFCRFSLLYSTDEGGGTVYYVGIQNGPQVPVVGSALGAALGPRNIIQNKVGDITIYVEGKDDDKNNSPEFFNTTEVKEATPILKSFKLLQ